MACWHHLLLIVLWTAYSGTLYYNPQEQSWKRQDLYFVPDNLDARLKRLDLSNNFITQLHTLGLPHLQRLDVSYNQLDFISEGAFVNLARLEELNLARNALNNNLGSNSKALQSISRLRTLDISMNRLDGDAVELYLRNKSSLVQLKLAGNSLTRLTRNLFRDSKCLRSISIEDNLITRIERGTFEPLWKLEALNLARNNIAHICDFKLHQIKYLNLSQNSIEFFVTQEDHKQYSLETLDLSHNKLLYFPIVPKINRLRYLYLQNNMVGASHSEEATLVSDASSLYKEITRDEDSAAEHEKINNVYSNWRLMPLVYVDLSNNNFRSFPLETLSLLTSMETLDFSNNCLQTISYNITKARLLDCHQQPSFSSLKTFALQNNGLVHISPPFLEALTNLETLNLQGNYVEPCDPKHHLEPPNSAQQTMKTLSNVSCVTFGRMKTLKHLNLKENGIKTLYPDTFERNPLVSLDLAGNPDISMPVGALEGLQRTLESLSISETNINSLALPCMPALTYLNISNNLLDTLPGSLSCSPLRELDIRNNAFRSLNHTLIRDLSVHLDAMHVSGNHFNCCDSQWLTILKGLVTKLPDINGAECIASIDKVLMTDYLKGPDIYCQFPAKPQEVTMGQATIIVIFVSVVLTMVIIFIREGLCLPNSFIV